MRKQRLTFNNNSRIPRHIESKGYWLIKCPDHPHANKMGYYFEHRIIFERWLQKHLNLNGLKRLYLGKTIHVHHKNGNRLDNRIGNLTSILRRLHCSNHMIGNKRAKKNMNDRICYDCGSTNTYVNVGTKYHNWCYYPDDKTKYLCLRCWRKHQWQKIKKDKEVRSRR